MPDNRLNDVRKGSYLTDYNYDTSQTGSEDTSVGDSSSTSNVVENIKRTPADKLSLYKEFIDNQKSIYTKLYKDLEPCFYGLLD